MRADEPHIVYPGSSTPSEPNHKMIGRACCEETATTSSSLDR